MCSSSDTAVVGTVSMVQTLGREGWGGLGRVGEGGGVNTEKLFVTCNKVPWKEILNSRICLDDLSTRAHKMVSSIKIYRS